MNKLYLPRRTSVKVSMGVTPNKPFVSLMNETGTVKLFVEALSKNRHEDALAYVSKNYAKNFDLGELSEYFGENGHYKHLVKVEFNQPPRNCITNSILVLENNKSSIIHLHMIKEPDKFGSWKIYSIDKE